MDILTVIWTWLTSGAGLWSSGGAAVLIISYMLKKYVDKDLWDSVGVGIENLFFIMFSVVTIFLNKATKGIWNKFIEPTVEMLLTVIFQNALKGSLRGLNSDDKLPNEGD